MLGAKVDVKGHELAHRAALGQAVPKILDGVNGGHEVGAGRVQRYADWCIPPKNRSEAS